MKKKYDIQSEINQLFQEKKLCSKVWPSINPGNLDITGFWTVITVSKKKQEKQEKQNKTKQGNSRFQPAS